MKEENERTYNQYKLEAKLLTSNEYSCTIIEQAVD